MIRLSGPHRRRARWRPRRPASGWVDEPEAVPGMSHVRMRGLSKSFGSVRAVRELNLDIERGELLAVLGPSGCGKTTLLRMIAGFEQPDAGCVVVSDEVVAGPGRMVPPEKRQVGMVFQDYALFPHLTRGGERGVRADARARARSATALTRRTLELVGLQHKAALPRARAVRRRAPARGARPGAGARARAGAAGRAVLEPRRDAARRAAPRGGADPARRRGHRPARDARPGGGALAGGPRWR